MAQGIALFGGSFDPLHMGHLIVGRAVAEHLSLSRVIFIPSANPPHKNSANLAHASDRMEMARLATADEPGFEVSDIEIQRSGPSYTVLTVQEYQQSVGKNVPLFWIIGADTLGELHTWYRLDELAELCRIVTADRPGFAEPDLAALCKKLSPAQIERLRKDILPTPQIDISATDIRRRVQDGLSIRYLVPDTVHDYIITRGLYQHL